MTPKYLITFSACDKRSATLFIKPVDALFLWIKAHTDSVIIFLVNKFNQLLKSIPSSWTDVKFYSWGFVE